MSFHCQGNRYWITWVDAFLLVDNIYHPRRIWNISRQCAFQSCFCHQTLVLCRSPFSLVWARCLLGGLNISPSHQDGWQRFFSWHQMHHSGSKYKYTPKYSCEAGGLWGLWVHQCITLVTRDALVHASLDRIHTSLAFRAQGLGRGNLTWQDPHLNWLKNGLRTGTITSPHHTLSSLTESRPLRGTVRIIAHISRALTTSLFFCTYIGILERWLSNLTQCLT